MPSGSKKRKAAKKKKVQHTNSSHNSNENDDVKNYDEKESDGGEVDSPASQNHLNSQPFGKGEEEVVEKREDTSSVQLLVPENNSGNGLNHGENMVKDGPEDEVITERESKSEDLSDTSIESKREVQNGGVCGRSSSSDSSSSSSSDEESDAVERKIAIVESGSTVDSVKADGSFLEVMSQDNGDRTFGETNNVIVESEPMADSVELVADSVPDMANQVFDSNPDGETDGSVEAVPTVDVVKTVDSSSIVVNLVTDSNVGGEIDGDAETVPVVDLVMPVDSVSEALNQVTDSNPDGGTDGFAETDPAVDLVKLDDVSSEVVDQVTDGTVGRETKRIVETVPAIDLVNSVDNLSEMVNQANNSVLVKEDVNEGVETAFVVEKDDVTLVEQVIQVIEGSSIVNHKASCVVELDLQESGEKKLPLSDDNTGLSPVLTESREKDVEVVSTSKAKAAMRLDAKDYATVVHEDKLILSYNASKSNDQIMNNEELVEDSSSPVVSVNQPLVPSAPRTVQKTSLKSCCGIFELFTGSDR